MTLDKDDKDAAPDMEPHWNALVDLHEILPCEVRGVQADTWHIITDIRKEEDGDKYFLAGDDGKVYTSTELGDPVLCRTLRTGAEEIK